MGIQGLIPFLDKVSSRINIAQFKDCCVAVDAYCWLHKGAYTCAEKLAKGEKCDAYVYYCMKYVNMLLSYNIKPILVFDGRHLPAKAGTEKKRRESRAANRKTATELLNAGRIEEARSYLRRCVDVTHTMALALIQECRKNNVDCIVAPYEADAQLAYLNLQNIAQVVITEDSDLILFGCSKIVFKLDLQGCGLLVEHERLHLSMRVRAENFSFDNFRYMCILSGCDYLPSLPGIGLNKALKFINKTKDPDIHRALRRMPAYLNMMQLQVSDEYRDSFVSADATFRYQPVFDPQSRSLVPLTKPVDGEEPPAIVDEQLSPNVALNLALGNLDPFTLERVDNFNPDCPLQGIASLQKKRWGSSVVSGHPSIWSQDFSGFQPVSKENQFPSMLNHLAIVDVTPLRMSKGPPLMEIDAKTRLLSPTELESMYGNGRPLSPQPKRQCLSPQGTMSDLPVIMPSVSSCPERKDAPTSTLCDGDRLQLQPPLSPILSQRKSRNPFAKPKQATCAGLGPPGAMGRPNYFSALRKFDGIYPMEVDSNVIVVSRSCGLMDKMDCVNSEKQVDDVLKDVSNTSPWETAQNVILEENSVLAAYTCEKESSCETSIQKNDSVLAAIEALQNKVNMPSPSKMPGNFSEQEEKNQIVRTVEKMEVNIAEEKERQQEEDHVLVKSLVPSFNWSQFTCRRSVSAPKLTSSQAVSQTFKNPFRKKCVSKCSGPLERGSGDVGWVGGKTSWLMSVTQQKIPEVDLEAEKSPVLAESSSFCANPISDDFKWSQNGPQRDPQASTSPDPFAMGPCGKMASLKAVEDELGPSEDTLWQQQQQQRETEGEVEEQLLSCGSSDSGYHGSLDTPKADLLDTNSARKHAATYGRGTPTGRRLGLGRSSTPSQAPPKQNLLAQYGFSKKRKLTH